MFATFFHGLNPVGAPVMPREYPTPMETIGKRLASRRIKEFLALTPDAGKDERNIDCRLRLRSRDPAVASQRAVIYQLRRLHDLYRAHAGELPLPRH